METGRGGELNKQDDGGGDCGFDGDLIIECEYFFFPEKNDLDCRLRYRAN